MKKLFVLAILALALIVTAVACTGGDEPADTTASTGATTDAGTEADGTDAEAGTTANTTATEETGVADTGATDETGKTDDTDGAEATKAQDPEVTEPEETKGEDNPPVVPTFDAFASDITSQTAGTDLEQSDLAAYFYFGLPTPGHAVEAYGEGLAYVLSGINEMYTDMVDPFAFTVNVLQADKMGAMFVRGTHQVHSVDLPEMIQDQNLYLINNYYETDGNGYMGGAGIFATITNGKLFINVKVFDENCLTHVGNKQYTVAVEGTNLTIADNGETVYFMVDGVLYATITLSGETTYDKLSLVSPDVTFAKSATVKISGKADETIENTLVASAIESQCGVVARGGSIKFDSLKIEAFEDVTIPDSIYTPEGEDAPKPGDPVLYISAEQIGKGLTNDATVEYNAEDKFVKLGFVDSNTADPADPWVLALSGNIDRTTKTLAIKYRTTSTVNCHIFIGSGAGPSGNGDVVAVDWNETGTWNLIVVDLTEVTALTGDASYLRLDFFTGETADTIDVAWIAFFENADEAQKYYNKEMGIVEPQGPAYNPDGYYQSNEIALGLGGRNSTPVIPGNGTVKKFGQRYNIGDGFLTKISILDIATYDDGNVNKWTLKVWQWDGNYEDTVAGTPLFEVAGENHQNNQSFTVAIDPAKYTIHGDIYYELEYVEGSKTFTGWGAAEGAAEGVEVYVQGELDNAKAYVAYITVLNETDGIPQDNHNFQSDAEGTKGETNVEAGAIDLKKGFTITLGQGDATQVYLAPDGVYHVTGFNSLHIPTNGAYAFTVKDFSVIVEANFATLFVRGSKDGYGESTYYGDDKSNSNIMGAAGLYFTFDNGQLRLNVKTKVDDAVVNQFIFLPCTGNDVTIVDDGKIVVLVDEVAVAVITVEETTVTVIDADGKVTTVENALVVDSHIADVGIATRGHGHLSFTAVSLMPYDSVTLPEELPEAPAEPDPDEDENSNYVVDLSKAEVVSGGPGYKETWPEETLMAPCIQMMNWGTAINLGEMDLSQYSQVIITCASDPTVVLGTNGHKLVLTSTGRTQDDSGKAIEYTELASAACLDGQGWTNFQTVTIDLSEVNHNGAVYLAHDMKTGNGLIIVKIEFVPAVAEQPGGDNMGNEGT